MPLVLALFSRLPADIVKNLADKAESDSEKGKRIQVHVSLAC
jgi:hypothetical protein